MTTITLPTSGEVRARLEGLGWRLTHDRAEDDGGTTAYFENWVLWYSETRFATIQLQASGDWDDVVCKGPSRVLAPALSALSPAPHGELQGLTAAERDVLERIAKNCEDYGEGTIGYEHAQVLRRVLSRLSAPQGDVRVIEGVVSAWSSATEEEAKVGDEHMCEWLSADNGKRVRVTREVLGE